MRRPFFPAWHSRGGLWQLASGAVRLPRRTGDQTAAGGGRSEQCELAARPVGRQNEIGDVLSAQGRLDEALSAYRAALAIRERLAAADQSNAVWHHHLSVSQERIGDVLSAQGRLDEALTAYRAGLAITVRLAAADPATPAGSTIWR